mgnify:CR=1 FL=1
MNGKIAFEEHWALLETLEDARGFVGGSAHWDTFQEQILDLGDIRLREMDKNGNGQISRDEAQGRIQRRFDRLDTNKDGQLDHAELEKAVELLRERAGGAENQEKKEGGKSEGGSREL